MDDFSLQINQIQPQPTETTHPLSNRACNMRLGNARTSKQQVYSERVFDPYEGQGRVREYGIFDASEGPNAAPMRPSPRPLPVATQPPGAGRPTHLSTEKRSYATLEVGWPQQQRTRAVWLDLFSNMNSKTCKLSCRSEKSREIAPLHPLWSNDASGIIASKATIPWWTWAGLFHRHFNASLAKPYQSHACGPVPLQGN